MKSKQKTKTTYSQPPTKPYLLNVVFFVLISLMFLPMSFATQWFENFEDQPLSNSAFISDNGTTAWNSSVITPTFTYHGIANNLSTKLLHVNNARALFITQVINASNASGTIDISFLFGVMGEKDKMGADDILKVYIKPIGGPRVLSFSSLLDDYDGENFVNTAQVGSFSTTYDVFLLEFEIPADKVDKKAFIDNILVEWLAFGEVPTTGGVDVNTNFTAVINNNVTSNVFINNTIIVQTGVGDNDTFNGFGGFGVLDENFCPLSEGSSDRLFYIVIIIISVVMFIFAFWVDNAMIGLLTSLLLIYIGIVSFGCVVFISMILTILGMTGILLSGTQLSLIKT